MKTATTSADDIVETIRALNANLEQQQEILARIMDRRRASALAAHQGDAAAKRELETIAADETAATAAVQNITLAIEQAESLKAAADAEGKVAAKAATQKRADKLSRSILDVDAQVVATIKTLQSHMQTRDRLVDELTTLGVLPGFQIVSLSGQNAPVDAIIDGLHSWMNLRVGPNHSSLALANLIASDAAALGLKAEEAPQSATVRYLQRTMHSKPKIGGSLSLKRSA